MFLHQFTYRAKTYLRNRSLLFWNAAFPLILMAILGVVLLPLGSEEGPDLNLPIAVIDNEYWQENTALRETITELSGTGDNPGLFATTVTDQDEAYLLLERGDVDGVIIPDAGNRLTLRVMHAGLSQTIIYSFTNQFTQISASITELAMANPQRTPDIMNALADYNSDDYFARDTWADRGNPYASFFFAVMGMALLYNMTFAIYEMNQLLGNQSPQGARLHISPAKRSRMLAASILICFIMQYAISWIMVLFMDLVLGLRMLEFAGELAVILLAATLCSIGLGMVIGIGIKTPGDTKISMAISFSTLMAFLAGMMSSQIRYLIIRNVPFLARLNPAELLTDSLFSIYFFDNPARVIRNSIQFLVYAFVLFVIAGLLLRRQKYESV